jgi:glycogen phosphorylase
MNILGRLTVLPHVPERLSRLSDIAYNLYWTWKPDAQRLFERLAPELWERVNHNPVQVLRDITQDKLEAAAQDGDYLRLFDEVVADFDDYMGNEDTWFARNHAKAEGELYAYFCAEYGWHESVALYSGGLGVLAGDHTKAASDLGVPLVGVGLWYPEGYFHQRVAADGQQEAVYQRHSPLDLPMRLVKDENGEEVRVSITIMGRNVEVRAWRVQVGRVPVYLMDSDIAENDPADRAILSRLYGGDQRTRIAQELILGIGGVRLLRALSLNPTSWHMNEGHSAFMALERCREFVEEGLSFDEAREVVAAGTTFTVHTPVAAGNDAFAFDLIGQFFSGYWGSLGLSQGEFFDLARHDHGWGAVYSMPALALRFSSGRNGVAELHGQTSRRIWNDLWPEVPTDEVPIGHVTNGVHSKTWASRGIWDLVSTVLPADWRRHIEDEGMWEVVRELKSADLWEVRRNLKAKSVEFLRRRVLKQQTRHGASPTLMHLTEALFNPDCLTIGFARRFATYKRATLIFRDLERLERILSNPDCPVQLVFAGKAHPADKPGQELIAEIHNLSQDPRFMGKIVFIEDYDIAVGRALTRGVDVWLNNPRRPNEASGTSGQKAAMNGILNLSILDGWWPEGYNGENGWAIGANISWGSAEQADIQDADALYDLLEREVVPLYYQRDAAGVPQAWLERAKEAIVSCSARFSARRMVQDYARNYYAPASARTERMMADDFCRARELASWKRHIRNNWHGIYFSAKPPQESVKTMGEALEVEVVLNPRAIDFEDLSVEVVYSPEEDGLKHNLHIVPMKAIETYEDGGCVYRATFTPKITGRIAYGARVYPVHRDLVSPFDVGVIRWA